MDGDKFIDKAKLEATRIGALPLPTIWARTLFETSLLLLSCFSNYQFRTATLRLKAQGNRISK